MQRFWSRLAAQLGRHAGVVSLVGLIVTLIAGLGLPKLHFTSGQDSYLNRSDQVYKDNVAYQELFGGQAVLSVVSMQPGHKVDELFTAENRRQFTTMHDTLTASHKVLGVITPVSVLDFDMALVSSPNGDPTASIAGKALLRAANSATPAADGSPQSAASLAARAEDATTTLGRLAKIPVDQRTLDNREWVKFLLYNNQGEIRKPLRGFFPDTRHVQVITRLLGNESLEVEGAAAVAVVDAASKLHFDNATVTTAGASLLLKELNDYLRGGMLTLGGIALAFMVLILVLLFDVRWRLLPLLVIVIGVTWAFGLAGFLGIPLTIVTIAGLPVMLGIGIDYAIQMHARVEEEVQIGETEQPIEEAARGLGPALLVVTFDAIFAFIALHFAKTPMIREFGTLLAVGIAAICIGSIVIPLAILGIREHKAPSKRHEWKEGFLGRLVVRLASVPPRAAVPFAVASVVVLVGGMAVEDKLTLQTDPIQWVSQESPNIINIEKVEHEVNSSNEMGVYATAKNVFSQEFVDFAHTFTRRTLAKYPAARNTSSRSGLETANSIEGSIGDLITDIPGADDVIPAASEVQAAFVAAPNDIQLSSAARCTGSGEATQCGAFNIAFRTSPGALDVRAPIVRGVRASTHPPAGITATPSGLAVVGVGLLDNLQANRILLTYLAILFVFAFLTVRLRSVVRALLSLVPVLIAVGTASLVAYALDLKLSPMTAVGGPLVVAACTEFTSLILLRFVEERNRGRDPHDSMMVAAARTGRAFIVSALTAITGVAVLSFSSLPLLRDFGRIVAMNVAVALLSALVVLPPMLIWADRRNWVSRGLVKRLTEET